MEWTEMWKGRNWFFFLL